MHAGYGEIYTRVKLALFCYGSGVDEGDRYKVSDGLAIGVILILPRKERGAQGRPLSLRACLCGLFAHSVQPDEFVTAVEGGAI
mgnify:CR=1 FL=1